MQRLSYAACARSAHRPGPGPSAAGGDARARSRCRFALPLIHFIPDSRTYSVSLFLKRRCDRTLGAADADGGDHLSLGASVLSFSLFGPPRCSPMANGSRRAFYLQSWHSCNACSARRTQVRQRVLAEGSSGGGGGGRGAPWRCQQSPWGTSGPHPGPARCLAVRHYITQPLVELYGGCLAVLKVS